MAARRRPSRSTRIALALLLVLALAVRLAVPSGWMPMVGGGTTRLVLCPADGAMPGGHHQHQRDDHSAADHPCAFAGLGLAADLPAVLPVAPPLSRLVAHAPVAISGARPGRGLAAPPPPATGPPFLA